MTDWTQERLEKFWRGLGAVQETHEDDYVPGLYIGNTYVGCNIKPALGTHMIEWYDPEEGPLEVLIRGMIGLLQQLRQWEVSIDPHVDTIHVFKHGGVEAPTDYRINKAGFIAAICKLLEIEEVE